MFISRFAIQIIIFITILVVFLALDYFLLTFFMRSEEDRTPLPINLTFYQIVLSILFLITFFSVSWILAVVGFFMMIILFSPVLKNERTRIFLDVVRLSISRGAKPEETFLEMAEIEKNPFKNWADKFKLFIECGDSFAVAVGKLRTGVPGNIISILQIGEITGDIGKVLPVCYKIASRQISKNKIMANFYFVPCAFLGFSLMTFICIFILPKFKMILLEMGFAFPSSGFLKFIYDNLANMGTISISLLIITVLLIAALVHVNKVRTIYSFLQYYVLPGQRKRLISDFALMLSMLIEAGVPEHDAVVLAGEATNNEIFINKAGQASALLADGTSLPLVIEKCFDTSGEFAWRFKNCISDSGVKGNISKSISNWCSWLEASAFKSEQGFTQLCSALLVLLTSLPILYLSFIIFYALASIIESMAIW